MAQSAQNRIVEETTQTILIEEFQDPQTGGEQPSACLIVISGGNIGDQHRIRINQTLIGRSINADIQVNDDSASRDHALIIKDRKGYRVADNESKNGCYINEKKVGECYLKDGDLLRIGNTIFKFLSGNNIEHAYHEELFRLAKIDGLTEIYNQRHFADSLENELERAKRYNRELSLLMIDIDHFKKVNDKFGHRAGDHILKKLADIFVKRSRKVDYVCRYGGEEFSIILPEIDIMGAFRFATTLKESVSGHKFRFENDVIPLTISIGISDIMEGIETTEELIETADRRLYLAKKMGRNRVVSADL